MTLEQMRRQADRQELEAFEALRNFIHEDNVPDQELLDKARKACLGQVWLRHAEYAELEERLFLSSLLSPHTH